ncbi:MAG: hypothetical protein QOD50_1060 [Actinomycetota bacterium]|nr:hypothetical protein [Actinomycetota bacterium]
MAQADVSTILLFSSNIRPLYEQDILNLSAVPVGTRYRFRYRAKYVEPELLDAWGAELRDRDVLVVYSLQQLKKYQDAAFIPIRVGKVLRAYVESADLCVIEFEVGRSASLGAPANDDAAAEQVKALRAFFEENGAGIPYPYSASSLRVALTASGSPIQVANSGAEDLALFERSTMYLSGVVSLLDVRYLRVVGVFPREKWAKGEREQVVRDSDTGSVVLKPGDSYIVEVLLQQPAEPVLPGTFDLAFDDDVIQVIGPKTITVNSRYDLVTVEVHAAQLGDDVERTGLLTIAPGAGTRGPAVYVPIKVQLGPARTAMTLGVSVGGLALIGLPAVIKDLPVAANLAILALGVFLTAVGPFVLRRTLPWKF